MLRRSNERGQSLIELTFTMPVLLLVLAGLIHFGMLMHTQQVITNASRIGARRATQLAGDAGSVQTAVRDYCQRAGLTGNVTVQTDINTGTSVATVTVSYPFSSPAESMLRAAVNLLNRMGAALGQGTSQSIQTPNPLQATTVMRL